MPFLFINTFNLKFEPNFKKQQLKAFASLQPQLLTLAGTPSSISTIVQGPSPATLQASLGQNLAFKIAGNPTTVYSWSILNSDELKQNNVLFFVKNEYASSATNPRIVGAGGNYYFFFKAVNSGNAQVKLQYKRSWEPEAIDLTVFTVNVA